MRTDVRMRFDKARGAAQIGVVWVLIALLLGFLAAMLVYRKPVTVNPPAEPQAVVQEQPAATSDDGTAAKVVTITPKGVSGDTLVVDPFHLPISVVAGHVVQWKNNTNETLLLLVTGAPLGEEISAGALSAPSHVCITCRHSPGGVLYPYRLYHKRQGQWVQALLEGPPGDPDIGVGD